MTDDTLHPRRLLNGWRIAGWGAALALLALPALGMMLTDEVDWTAGDFVAASVMLLSTGAAIELAAHRARGTLHRLALILSALIALLTVWANGAVGIIGSETEAINLAFYAMVVVGILAAIVLRGRARAMMALTALLALGQIATGLAAEAAGTPEWGPPLFFALLWACAALLFRQAASSVMH